MHLHVQHRLQFPLQLKLCLPIRPSLTAFSACSLNNSSGSMLESNAFAPLSTKLLSELLDELLTLTINFFSRTLLLEAQLHSQLQGHKESSYFSLIQKTVFHFTFHVLRTSAFQVFQRLLLRFNRSFKEFSINFWKLLFFNKFNSDFEIGRLPQGFRLGSQQGKLHR